MGATTPPTPSITFKHNKIQVDSERMDMEQSTMFSENIIISKSNLTFCTLIKMPASREDKFNARKTKCRFPM